MGKFFVLLVAGSALFCAPPQTPSAVPPSPGNPLPDGVDQNSTEFRRKLNLAPTNARTRARPADCTGCPDVQVTIRALGNTHLVDPDNAPAGGVEVAQLTNEGNRREKYYGLKPRTDADYFLWVDRIPGTTKAQWTLVEVPINDGTVLAGKPTPLIKCHRRQSGHPARPDADFAEYRPPCEKSSASAASVKMNSVSMFPIGYLAALIDRISSRLAPPAVAGGWIECSYGCCT